MTRRLPPQTSAAPDPATIFMAPTSTAEPPAADGTNTAAPQATPLPPVAADPQTQQAQPDDDDDDDDDDDPSSSSSSTSFPVPTLRLHINDLAHPGATRFLAALNAPAVLAASIRTVLRLLYVSPDDRHHTPPPTRSVTLILKPMPGVAYTTGTALDNDHKEIHFSLDYISNIKRTPSSSPPGDDDDRTGTYEMHGVLVHELVHCFQHNGRGRCPPGLVEGVADWVRLRASLGAPHWRRDAVPERWDQGYEKTAFFLEWLETRFGPGSVRRINGALASAPYDEGRFWGQLFGSSVEMLWEEYLKVLRGE